MNEGLMCGERGWVVFLFCFIEVHLRRSEKRITVNDIVDLLYSEGKMQKLSRVCMCDFEQDISREFCFIVYPSSMSIQVFDLLAIC